MTERAGFARARSGSACAGPAPGALPTAPRHAGLATAAFAGANAAAAAGRVRAFVGLGANLGDPVAQLRDAIAALDSLPGTVVIAASSLYRSAPVGYLDQPDFYNAVAEIDTGLTPQALLAALLGIEQDGGRTREFRNAPRSIDLDLLLYGDQTVDDVHLTVPHPRMADRAFVLLPLAEIAPGCVIPGLGEVAALVDQVQGQSIERLGAFVSR